ncbi:MAG: hypothetical protein JXC36_09070 [Candidatus Atribacteria bacterium]|nr:hypothetical protein [Candidatus Atribacteria bacterium]
MNSNRFILLLIVLAFFFTWNNVISQDTDFESFLNLHIEKAIVNGQINQDPLIIVQGLPIDSTNKHDVFSILEKSDVKELSVLETEKALDIFDNNAKNGVVLVVLNRNGKKKLKRNIQ